MYPSSFFTFVKRRALTQYLDVVAMISVRGPEGSSPPPPREGLPGPGSQILPVLNFLPGSVAILGGQTVDGSGAPCM